jgi:TRAP-type C4-dicarboxylate transport system permease small subunit
MATMTRALHVVHRCLDAASTVAFIVMVICLLLEILARDVLRVPMVWTEELAGFLFLWVIFLGAAQAAYLRQHIQVEFLLESLPTRVAHSLRLVIALLMWIFAAVLLVGGIQMTLLTWDNYSQTVDWLRVGYSYLALDISALLMVCTLGRDVVAATRRVLPRNGA